MPERTLAIIKPDATGNKSTGQIIDRILSAGFRIVAMRQERLSRKKAEEFYAVHKHQTFYDDLVDFMSSGPSVVMVLEKKNAVEEFRALIGATDPKKARQGTIRSEFAQDVQRNAVHGSDSNETAEKEIAFFFPAIEIPAE